MLNFLFTIKDLLIQIVGVGNVILNGNVVLTMLNALPGSYKKNCARCVFSRNTTIFRQIDI
jgi:hypothetical protein